MEKLSSKNLKSIIMSRLYTASIQKIGLEITFVFIAARLLQRLRLFENTRKFTPMNGRMLADFAAKDSSKRFTCKHTCSGIPEKNHGFVMFVEKALSPMLFSKNMPSFIPPPLGSKNHMLAINAIKQRFKFSNFM